MTTHTDITVTGPYYCPMKCEGEKVYDQSGNCPVCNMHLVPVNGQKKGHMVENQAVDSHHRHEKHQPHDHEEHQQNHETVSQTQDGAKYYCSMRCEGDKVYDQSGDCPVCGMHLKKEESSESSRQIYTCPMHPEVKQSGPGSCPRCGMDLVPEKGEETSEEEKAYKKMAKKFTKIIP